MKAIKIEILIIDHDELGEQSIKEVLENTKYSNWCISPDVKSMQTVDIGEWDDDHPLNTVDKDEQYYSDIFK